MVTTISNAKLIENHHAVDGKTLHDELSIKIRKVFATELSDQEIKNAIDICSIGKSYTIEVPISGDIFNEEHLYDINGIIQMSPLFKAVKRITLSKRNDVFGRESGSKEILGSSFLRATSIINPERSTRLAKMAGFFY